mmetsp:Transcript_76495/g.198850  ORF Transcript_76495/g.198850 Transcript_76495/m.198850 type:complete len:225 (-) Transcript_76495:241-915(-)
MRAKRTNLRRRPLLLVLPFLAQGLVLQHLLGRPLEHRSRHLGDRLNEVHLLRCPLHTLSSSRPPHLPFLPPLLDSATPLNLHLSDVGLQSIVGLGQRLDLHLQGLDLHHEVLLLAVLLLRLKLAHLELIRTEIPVLDLVQPLYDAWARSSRPSRRGGLMDLTQAQLLKLKLIHQLPQVLCKHVIDNLLHTCDRVTLHLVDQSGQTRDKHHLALLLQHHQKLLIH